MNPMIEGGMVALELKIFPNLIVLASPTSVLQDTASG
jgi:hypothetical protein